LSRGSPVTRFYGTEILEISGRAIDLSRVEAGVAPLLDSHRQDTVLHRREIDVARRLAPCALDLQPGKAAVDGLVDSWGWIDRLTIAPQFQLSQSNLSACWISASPLVRASSDRAARILAIARALPSSLVRALRSPPDRGVGWYFGAIRTSTRREIASAISRPLRHFETWPAPVFLVPACASLARVVQEPLRDVLPHRFAAV
jgi:hypothetical protein